MSALREAAQQALEALELVTDLTNHDDEIYDAITTLRAALKQETEAAAWLAERKNHWRKEREKALAAKDQDPELSAALGWPGGISNPVLDRVQLLQMVAALRVSAQQALEALKSCSGVPHWPALQPTIDALRAALAQEQTEPDISRCPQCNGPADNGFDRSIPPNPYLCTKCMAEPLNLSDRAVQKRLAAQWGYVPAEQAEQAQEPVAWLVMDESGYVQHAASWRDAAHEHINDAINEHDLVCARTWRVVPAYTAPPRRTMVPLAQAEPDISRCPQCNGPADNGHDRSIPPSPYLCTSCMAEPAQDPTVWAASKDGRVIYDAVSTDDVVLRISGDFEDDEQRIRYTQQIVDALNAALLQRTMVPLTEQEIESCRQQGYAHAGLSASFDFGKAARAVEKASWEKNHGQA